MDNHTKSDDPPTLERSKDSRAGRQRALAKAIGVAAVLMPTWALWYGSFSGIAGDRIWRALTLLATIAGMGCALTSVGLWHDIRSLRLLGLGALLAAVAGVLLIPFIY